MNLESLARAVAHVAGSDWHRVEEFVDVDSWRTEYSIRVAYTATDEVFGVQYVSRVEGYGKTRNEAVSSFVRHAQAHIRDHRKPYDAELDRLLKEVGK